MTASTTIGFRRHLRAEVVSGEAAYLLSEHGVTALMGAQIEALAPLLDGTRDLSAVLRDMPPGTTAEQVDDLVTRLTLAGLVRPWQPPPAGIDERALAYWDAAGLNPIPAATKLAATRVQLITLHDLDAATGAAATEAFHAAGLNLVTEPGAGADLAVVLCTDYLDPALAEIDATHRRAGRSWLLAKPVGSTVWVGPVFEPSGACWHCLAVRLRAHRQAEAYVQGALGRTGPAPRSAVALAPLRATAVDMVALEATKWLAGYRHAGQRAVWTFDSLDLHGRLHELRSRPQCPACGDPALVAAQTRRPLRLTPRPKTSTSGGGHRSMAPEQVLDRYRHLISPVTGVVKEVVRDRRGPEFFNVFRSGPNLAARARSLHGLRASLRTESGGKGTTALHAEVSALCEALERQSGRFHGDEERVRGSLRTLGERAIHPNRCQLYHERQYAGRDEWNATHSPFHFVCAPFDEDAELVWTPVWSLTERRHRLVPTAMLYFGAPTAPGGPYACADSNGSAAGSSLEDAVLQGMLEVIERDAVGVWWYNRGRVPGVDLDHFADPWIDELREVYAGLGREVWVLDVTADLRVPTMVAVSRCTDAPEERIMFGFGAHLDPRVALRRALTEMNQLMPAVLRYGPDGCGDDPVAVDWLRNATVENQPYVTPRRDCALRRPSAFEYQYCTDLADDVGVVRNRMEALGLEVLVLDQTRPDIGLPVAKVIVPGMRHLWARFAPGRLYDVPVRLGRQPGPTPYSELNPVPLFL